MTPKTMKSIQGPEIRAQTERVHGNARAALASPDQASDLSDLDPVYPQGPPHKISTWGDENALLLVR